MAYQLKYYKSITTKEHIWRIDIYQETIDVLISVEIGSVLQGLRLIVQGDQADIDTPIVKTSLEMTFVDAPGLEDNRKCGYWEEFYTSSSTEYKVTLSKDNTIQWSGYITPDSFSESLQYRGSVTIIARDNLGALQDYEFDMISQGDGMISLSDILNNALQRVSFPMTFGISNSGVRKNAFTNSSTFPTYIYDSLFNVAAFNDKTWLEAIESALTSTGYVMRYVGDNHFMVSSIRDMPLYNYAYWWDIPIEDVSFCAYGQRELAPAVKSIIDEVQFEIEDSISKIYMPGSAFGNADNFFTFTSLSDAGSVSNPVYDIPVHAIIGGNWELKNFIDSLAFDAHRYPLKAGKSSRKYGDIHDVEKLYIAANGGYDINDSSKNVEYRQRIAPGKYSIEFSLGKPIGLYDGLSKVGFIDADVNLKNITFSLAYISLDESEVKYYNSSKKTWQDGAFQSATLNLNQPFPVTLSFEGLETNSIGYIVLTIYSVQAALQKVVSVEARGMYIPVENLKIMDANLENTTIPGFQKITTEFNKKNNILLQRNVDFGFIDAQVASPKLVTNGIFVENNSLYESSDDWLFDNSQPSNPFPVLVHQQLLAYYSKPNNILTGELAIDNPVFNALYRWNNRLHLIASGALNMLTGRMENVILREFMRYDHLWETWVENENITCSAAGDHIDFRVHSSKDLDVDSWGLLPSWITAVGDFYDNQQQFHVFSVKIEKNTTPLPRTSIFSIDTALVKITQQANI